MSASESVVAGDRGVRHYICLRISPLMRSGKQRKPESLVREEVVYAGERAWVDRERFRLLVMA